MVLGRGDVGRTLKKKDSNTVLNQVAWVDEDELDWVDSNFKKNMEFIDWYSEHKEDFCGDCLAWFPDNGKIDPETDDDYVCPNEKCPGRLYDTGMYLPAVDKGRTYDECPECGFEFNM